MNADALEVEGQKREAHLKALLDSGQLQWHNDRCMNRHGTVTGIKSVAERNEIVRTLNWFFGDRCAWRTRGARPSLEFVHKAKVFPPPSKPWEWCGESVLFEDWRRDEEQARSLAASFRLGEKVAFTAKGRTIEGIVSNAGKRVTVVTDGQKWYVPAGQLTRLP